MEVGQGPNWGCSAKGNTLGRVQVMKFDAHAKPQKIIFLYDQITFISQHDTFQRSIEVIRKCCG
jgi:hypothetical protein